ncbi:MAG: Rho termination factor N-terminal domain-containing protein, partial [Lachnospiraceae bacterium]|nr:Rho termination factor N-terminal domain-containing protein [Lachnospiraceae bacterium]
MTKKSLAELRALAKSMNLRGVSGLRKQELAEVLSRQMAAAGEGAVSQSVKTEEQPVQREKTDHPAEKPKQAAIQEEAAEAELSTERPIKRKAERERREEDSHPVRTENRRTREERPENGMGNRRFREERPENGTENHRTREERPENGTE